MNPSLTVLMAVAEELSAQAKENAPELQAGETVTSEWFSDGVYFRQTTLNGESFLYQINFRERKGRRAAVVCKKVR